MREQLKPLYEESIEFNDVKNYQLEIWQWILNSPVDVNVRFRNPRRTDKNPGALLRSYNGFITLLDTPDPLHGLNPFQAIQKLYKCSFSRALQIVYYEALNGKPPLTYKFDFTKAPAKEFLIKVRRRKWQQRDSPFWNIGGITCEQLLSEKCNPLTSFWCTNKNGVFVKTNPKFDVYVNVINNRLKLYGPEKRLFLTNFKKEDMGGLKPFVDYDLLIITKNLKSYMILSNLGFNVRYVPSESALIHSSFIEIMKKFKQIIFLMDNDSAGYEYAYKLLLQWQKYNDNAKTVFFPEEGHYIDCFGNKKNLRDSYDFCFAFGTNYLKKTLKNIL